MRERRDFDSKETPTTSTWRGLRAEAEAAKKDPGTNRDSRSQLLVPGLKHAAIPIAGNMSNSLPSSQNATPCPDGCKCAYSLHTIDVGAKQPLAAEPGPEKVSLFVRSRCKEMSTRAPFSHPSRPSNMPTTCPNRVSAQCAVRGFIGVVPSTGLETFDWSLPNPPG